MALHYRGGLTAIFAATFLSFPRFARADPPTASVTSVSLSDLDLDKDELGGTVVWTAPAETSEVTHYNVYLATDAFGAGKTPVALNVPLGTSTASLSENTAVGSSMYVVVMTANADGEQTNTPGAALLEDALAVINSLSFIDLDLDAGHIGGVVRWTERGTAPVSKYNVYFAEDAYGQGRILLSAVLAGTVHHDILPDTAYGTHSYICVYPVSSLGEASTSSSTQFYDVDSPVRNLVFTDLDLDLDELGGRLSWVAPMDSMDVTGYVVTRSFDGGSDNLGSYDVGSEAHDVPANTAIGPYSYYNVYSKSSLAKMTTPVSILVLDNVASASDIVFQDLDLDTNELGGAISWSAAADDSYVESYALYLASTVAGASRSGRVGAASLDLERAVGTNTQRGSYNYFVVYTSSSLVEQSTPAFLAITDVAATPRDLHFLDQDADSNRIAGTLTWSAPTDVSQVVGYRVYSAKSSMGEGRRTPGTEYAVGGSLELSVPAIALGTFTHFVVYALSSEGEQDTPASLSIVDLSWTEGAWNSCSAACGPGTQSRIFTCSSAAEGACDGLTQPDTTRECSNSCSWSEGAWTSCSAACGPGTQSRTLTCSSATEDACDGLELPETTRECSSFCPWTTGAWDACSKACGQGEGIQTRAVTCSSTAAVGNWCDNSRAPLTTQTCSSFCPWTSQAWGACDCRTGTKVRSVTCSANSDAECGGSLWRPDAEKTCAAVHCGCGKHFDHDLMRPWGENSDMSCDTQFWVIVCIIVVAVLAVLIPVVYVMLCRKKKTVAPQNMGGIEIIEAEEKECDNRAQDDEDGVDV